VNFRSELVFVRAFHEEPHAQHQPTMLPRLGELEEDLITRRRAQEEGWKGEIEGLDLTLTFLRSKRAQTRHMMRMGAPGHADLGMPVLPPHL
jgi:hypothetical protein